MAARLRAQQRWTFTDSPKSSLYSTLAAIHCCFIYFNLDYIFSEMKLLACAVLFGLLASCAHGQRAMLFCSSAKPGMPANLVATADNGKIDLKWDRPLGNACVTAYNISCVRADGVGKTLAFQVDSTSTFITNVANSQKYNVTVQAVNSRYQGPIASTAVTPQGTASKWQCIGEQSYTPCQSAAAQLCQPLSCKRIAELDYCSEPWMRSVDWEKHTIKQSCINECGCPAEPTLRQTLAAPQPDICCAFKIADYYN